jgi:hypothetical protein
MTARQFNWKEAAQLIGGIALVAMIQAGLLLPNRPDFIGSWIIMTVFGMIYAVIGGVTNTSALKQRNGNDGRRRRAVNQMETRTLTPELRSREGVQSLGESSRAQVRRGRGTPDHAAGSP